ncbi:hypothetical protein M2342_002319 [Sphingobium sp. B8D3A]|nr:hypothetical protein [Sphingobium sp. B8D3A]
MNRLLKNIRVFLADRRKAKSRRTVARAVIGQSRLFNAEWYVETYPDVVTAKLDPLDHFIDHGAHEGRNPSSRFDLRWYVKRYPDVEGTGINPLLHYLQYGRDEGRSIRPVNPSASDGSADHGRPKGKKHASRPKSPPYPSDFRSTWRARPYHWASLRSASQAGPTQNASTNNAEPLDDADWLIATLRHCEADILALARWRLFAAMRPDTPVQADLVAVPTAPDLHEARHLEDLHGLGLDIVADGWFSGGRHLILRVHNLPQGASAIKGFQFSKLDGLAACGRTDLNAGEVTLLNLELIEELGPLLLAAHSPDGALLCSALVPFPSLFRGGLHQAEFVARQAASPSLSLNDYMTRLARSTFAQRDASGTYAIGDIVVDLKGANGSERLCNPHLIEALARHFGVRCFFRAPPDSAALQILAARLSSDRAGANVSARRASGRELTLPVDCFPSLAGLTAHRGDPELDAYSFCIVDAATGQPPAFASHPSESGIARIFHHPALPLPVAELDGGGLSKGSPLGGNKEQPLPIMIRYRDSKIWAVDRVMPVSPDVRMPGLSEAPVEAAASKAAPIISIIVERPSDDHLLRLCLASLARQTIASNLEIIVMGGGAQTFGQSQFAAARLIDAPLSGSSPAEDRARAVSLARAGHMLFLDGSLCLPDPRTLALLLEIARQPNIGTVSCALVEEDTIDGSASIVCAGLFPSSAREEQSCELREVAEDVAAIFPATTYRVLANTMRLCLTPASAWQLLSPADLRDARCDADVAMLMAKTGLHHYCTTLTSATTVAPTAGPDQTSPSTPIPGAAYSISAASLPSVAAIRRLRR